MNKWVPIMAFSLLFIFFVFIPFLFAYWTDGISNEEIISLANQSAEAQKFLEKYPFAQIDVDRSGALAVDYMVDTANPEKYLRLRVFIDPIANKPAGEFIDCYPQMIYSGILKYIESNTCLEQKD